MYDDDPRIWAFLALNMAFKTSFKPSLPSGKLT